MIRLIIVAFALSLTTATAAPDKLGNPALESRAVALQKELRCLVCQGESLDESNAPLAADLRRLIRERLAAGDSNEAVKRYLVARYGDFILMKPPVEKETYVLWFAPLIALGFGAVIAGTVAWRARVRWLHEANGPLPDHITGNTPENS
jgi:cytochrome c-type biogenesis protein CcmH